MKKISLSKLEGFLKARCDDLREAGLDATEYRDYIIAMIFLKRVNDTFACEQAAHKARLHREFPDLSEEDLAVEIEMGNADAYEFFVPLKARWKVEVLPPSVHSHYSQQRSEAKGKLEDGRVKGVERERWQKALDEAEETLNWRGLLNVKSDVGEALTRALKELEESNGKVLGGVLSTTKFNEVNSKGEKKIPDAKLIQLVNDFNAMTLTDDNFEFPDLLGAAYEYLLKYFAESAGKKGGEFYTPAPVVELMGKVLRPAKNAEICDPTVGSGGLLINMRNYVESCYGSSRDLTLYGQELIDHTYKMCKMNMIFHGIKDARIEQGDTLLTPKLTVDGKLKLFDIVVANPPFSQNYSTAGMKYPERFLHFMPKKKKADFMFVQHMVSTLKPDGRMAVVMPHGVLFRGGEEAAYRKELIAGAEGCLLECVIGLPPELFYGTPIPASILVINKKGAKTRKGVFFINADREYAEGKNQNMLRPEDVEKISYVYVHKSELPKYSRLVPVEELAAEDFCCNIRRYVDNAPDAEPQDVSAHLHGGVPEAEIEALLPMTLPWGDVPKEVFAAKKRNVRHFAKAVGTKDQIGPVVRSSSGVAATLRNYVQHVGDFWSKVEPDLKQLAKKKDVFHLNERMTAAFVAEFGKCEHPVLDEYQTRGSFAQYLSELKADFKSVATSAWNAELIPEDEILESQFPEVLANLRKLEARKAELQAKFDAVDALESEEDWNAEDFEVMPRSEIKRVKAEIKAVKGERREVEKSLRALDKRERAYVKAKDPVPEELKRERAELSVRLPGFDAQIAALEGQIARHVALEEEKSRCSSEIRTIERHKDELVEEAREKISPDEARDLILTRWLRTLEATVSGYLEAKLRMVIAALENLYDKYTVPLGDMLAARDAARAKLDAFLSELGYGEMS